MVSEPRLVSIELMHWLPVCCLQNSIFMFLPGGLGESIEVLGESERQKELISGFLAVYLLDTYLNRVRSI